MTGMSNLGPTAFSNFYNCIEFNVAAVIVTYRGCCFLPFIVDRENCFSLPFKPRSFIKFSVPRNVSETSSKKAYTSACQRRPTSQIITGATFSHTAGLSIVREKLDLLDPTGCSLHLLPTFGTTDVT